jgi:hypothetical protein
MVARLEALVKPYFASILPDYTLRSSAFIAKRGGPDQQPLRLHQDYTYVDIAKHRGVHVWVPLLDVNESNGCLTVVPRSHSLVDHIGAMINNPSPYDEYRSFLDAACTLPLEIQAGTAIFFDERLLHGSTRNSNPNIRIATAFALLPRDVEQLIHVVDDDAPSKLNVLEVRDEFALRLGRGVKVVPPYPEGIRKIGEVPNTVQKLSQAQVDTLRVAHPAPHKMPPAPPVAPQRSGLLSKFGFFSSAK